MNGKRHKKKVAKGGFAVAPGETKRDPKPEPLTGTNRVMLDNTVPGGWRYDHTPGKVP